MARPSPGDVRLRRPLPAFLIFILVVVAIASKVSGALGDAAGFGVFVGHLTAGALMLRRGRALEPHERRAWLPFALALWLGAGGVLAVGVASSFGVVVPAFGIFDAIFLGGYVLLITGLIRIARMDPSGANWRQTILDALIGVVAATAIVWDFVLDPLLSQGLDITWWERWIASLYPVLDIGVMFGLLLMALRRSQFRFDGRLMFIGIGLGIQVVADLTYLRAGVGRTFAEAQPEYWLFLISSACYVWAGSILDRRAVPREFADRKPPAWVLFWPYGFAAALVPLHVVKVERVLPPGIGERVVLYSLVAVGVLVFVRQVVAINSNRVTVEKQRRELVASVSHELRTPLTAVVGYLDMLTSDPGAFGEDERNEMMTTVNSQAQHMARIVTDLIMLARDGGSSLDVRRAAVDIETLCRQAVAFVPGLDITLDLEVDRGAHVLFDGERLTQALINLLSNAQRYGGGACTVVARTRGEAVVIEIHDDGPGVPVRHANTIWQQFERGAYRLDSNTPGLGIGLAIVKAVAEAHGGTATYRRSERLGGACFSLRLPLAPPVAEQPLKVLNALTQRS
jgi:signal transduction histidine kinase